MNLPFSHTEMHIYNGLRHYLQNSCARLGKPTHAPVVYVMNIVLLFNPAKQDIINQRFGVG